ncbi:putative ribonuclease H-like domain-containing protein [Tanacetum coccineum]
MRTILKISSEFIVDFHDPKTRGVIVGRKTSIELLDDPNMPELEDIVYSDDDEDVGAEADMNNLDAFMPISPILTTSVHKDHPVKQIIEDLNSTPQTRRMIKNLEEHEEPKKVIHALKDPSWIEAMQEELLQFKLQEVWSLMEQEEGIDYDEVFTPITRIEAIRLFLAYASFKDFVVCQMDVKSAFLYSKIEEEAHVCQPSGFEDPDFTDRVYKVEKTLYGLHQAPKAWYETLSIYLLDNGFQRGKIDKTLFIKMDKGNILLVQVYVDDIIFGSTKKLLCIKFEKIMHKKFQMSSMGELTFFLGLQVKQKDDGIFISQDKYVTEILKKFSFTDVKTASTPMETQKALLKDEDSEEVDVHLYRSMIGSLMYLTSSRPDIMFTVCACARYQVNPKVSHLHAVKRIFRYLKGQPKLGIWYLKDSPFDLVAYTDSDHAGASLDRKATIGDLLTKAFDYALTVNPTIYASCIKQFRATAKVKTINGEVQLQALVDEKKIIITESTVRRDLQLEDAEVFLNQEVGEISTHNMIYVTPSHTKKIFGNMIRVGKGFSGKETSLFQTMVVQAQEEMGEDEAVNKEMDDSLVRATTTASSLEAESARMVFSNEASLGDQEDASKQGRKIDDIDANEDIYLVNVHRDEDMFGVNDLEGDEVVVETEFASKDVNLSIDEVTLAQALAALKSAKPKADKVKVQDKGKGIMVEEPLKMKKKDQVSFDEQEAIRLKAEFDKEERLAREKDEVNVALTEEWDNVQAMIDADYQMAQQMQAEYQEKLSIEKKSKLFIQLLEARKKNFAVMRAKEKRNRPPTKAQKRSKMSTYLKNIDGYKHNQLKNKSFDDIQKLFEKAMKRIAQESSSKRAGEALEQESSKKQKLEEDKESEELKQCLEIVPDDGDDVTIDAIPLSTKSPTIVVEF